jgi:mannose-1-phosphate guanylyltransferase
MVQATVNRILSIIPGDHIFFATNQEYAQIISEQVNMVPPGNIIQEPSAKHTAPCIGLAALHMQQLDPNAVMASLHADHFIADEEGFRQALLAAEQVARQGYLVTLGITPNKPETGYGYVQRGAELGQYNGYPVYQVNRFLEKPDLATAERFLASGEYYWNSGIFIWQISTLMQAFQEHLPDLHQKLNRINNILAAGQRIDPVWQTINPVSIDVGIMERAPKVAMIPVDIGWNDVGSWDAIYEIGQPDQHNNIINSRNCVTFDTQNSLIQGGDQRFIAAIGLDNVVIVDTGDALLVCARDKVQDVKKVVNWLEEQGRSELL